MTAKDEKRIENALVLSAMREMNESRAKHVCMNEIRLRSCNATVGHTDSFWYLRSYKTIIACIDDDGVCYDFLRYVYGYTATSAQHIAKFMKEYGCGTKYTYYPIAGEE